MVSIRKLGYWMAITTTILLLLGCADAVPPKGGGTAGGTGKGKGKNGAGPDRSPSPPNSAKGSDKSVGAPSPEKVLGPTPRLYLHCKPEGQGQKAGDDKGPKLEKVWSEVVTAAASALQGLRKQKNEELVEFYFKFKEHKNEDERKLLETMLERIVGSAGKVVEEPVEKVLDKNAWGNYVLNDLKAPHDDRGKIIISCGDFKKGDESTIPGAAIITKDEDFCKKNEANTYGATTRVVNPKLKSNKKYDFTTMPYWWATNDISLCPLALKSLSQSLLTAMKGNNTKGYKHFCRETDIDSEINTPQNRVNKFAAHTLAHEFTHTLSIGGFIMSESEPTNIYFGREKPPKLVKARGTSDYSYDRKVIEKKLNSHQSVRNAETIALFIYDMWHWRYCQLLPTTGTGNRLSMKAQLNAKKLAAEAAKPDKKPADKKLAAEAAKSDKKPAPSRSTTGSTGSTGTRSSSRFQKSNAPASRRAKRSSLNRRAKNDNNKGSSRSQSPVGGSTTEDSHSASSGNEDITSSSGQSRGSSPGVGTSVRQSSGIIYVENDMTPEEPQPAPPTISIFSDKKKCPDDVNYLQVPDLPSGKLEVPEETIFYMPGDCIYVPWPTFTGFEPSEAQTGNAGAGPASSSLSSGQVPLEI